MAAALIFDQVSQSASSRGWPIRARTPLNKSSTSLRAFKIFGIVCPVLVEGDGGIIAGPARIEAAKLRGMTDTPPVLVDHLNPAQIRAYVIVDNKLAETRGGSGQEVILQQDASGCCQKAQRRSSVPAPPSGVHIIATSWIFSCFVALNCARKAQ